MAAPSVWEVYYEWRSTPCCYEGDGVSDLVSSAGLPVVVKAGLLMLPVALLCRTFLCCQHDCRL